MSKFIALNMVEAGRASYNEDTGREEVTETTKPVAVNADNIRCFYARRDGKPGTRLTFNDGGGFAVTETADAVALAVAGGELAARLSLAIAAPASEAVS
jgi:hypothetical protein